MFAPTKRIFYTFSSKNWPGINKDYLKEGLIVCQAFYKNF